MKRTLLAILLYLLLGLTTTIGVAWAFASMARIGQEMECVQWGDNGQWYLRHAKAPGVEWLYGSTGLSRSGPYVKTMQDLPTWSRLRHPPASLAEGSEPFSLIEDVRGWPWPALKVEWVRDMASNGQTVIDAQPRGGIRVPRWETLDTGYEPNYIPWNTVNNHRALPLVPIWSRFLGDIIFWSIAWIFLSLLFFLPFIWRTHRRRKHDRCIGCAYDLRGVERNLCSECGLDRNAPISIITGKRIGFLGGCLGIIVALTVGGAGFGVYQRIEPTTIHTAARDGDLETLRAELAQGVSVDLAFEHDVDELLNSTPLMWAARTGNIEAAPMLLDAGADLEARDQNQWTALHVACNHRQPAFVRWLLDAGADLNAIDANGNDALTACAFGNDAVECAEILIDTGIDVKRADGWGSTPLVWASRRGSKELATLLLDAGAAANPGYKWSPLEFAAGHAWINITRRLIDAGAAETLDAKRGMERAANGGSIECLQMLIDAGVPLPDELPGEDSLALWAVFSGRVEMVQFILDLGYHASHIGFADKTALDWARERQDEGYAAFIEIVDMLERAGQAERDAGFVPMSTPADGSTISPGKTGG